MNKKINQYFKRHQGFAKVWDMLKKYDLVNKPCVSLVCGLFDRSNRLTCFQMTNPGFTFEVYLKNYEVLVSKSLIVIASGENRLTFDLREVIIRDSTPDITKFKRRNELRVY